MIKSEEAPEIFLTDFKILARTEQQAILRRILQDQRMRHDLIDLVQIEERRDEPARPLREYIS